MAPCGFAKLSKKLPQFKDWLRSAGAEVLEPTNEWEVLRFRAGGSTAVIYRNKANQLNMGRDAEKALTAFLSGQSWSAGVKTTRRSVTVHERALLKRDGPNCFLCWHPLGADITVEHLVPVTAGGPNHMANFVLAHHDCNGQMGSKSVMEKIAMREARRPRPSHAPEYHQAMALTA